MRRAAASARQGVPARCPLGGRAPCMDDLCHGGGQTVCGLWPDEDFCWHGYLPETCWECRWEEGEDVADDEGDPLLAPVVREP